MQHDVRHDRIARGRVAVERGVHYRPDASRYAVLDNFTERIEAISLLSLLLRVLCRFDLLVFLGKIVLARLLKVFQLLDDRRERLGDVFGGSRLSRLSRLPRGVSDLV